jgi:hypothetical protein
MPLILPAASLALMLGRVPGLAQAQDTQGKETTQPKPPDEKKRKKTTRKKKKDEQYPQFRLDDHPSIRFGKGTHLDFRGRFAGECH